MSIWEDRLLYVINHAFGKGGERVEVFELKTSPELKITYSRSIRFPDKYAGNLNDLVMIGLDEFYITEFWPVQ